MRLSFSTLACPEWGLRQIVEAAATHGISGVDFRGLGPEIDITRLPQFTISADAGYYHLRPPFVGLDPSGVGFALSGHLYMK